MNAYTSMRNKLLPLGIYNLNSSVVDNELHAYAVALDVLSSTLNTILSESFISTAQDYGLSRREKVFSKIRDDLTVSKRREMLQKRDSITTRDFTRNGIAKSLDSFGIEYTLIEYFTENRVMIQTQGHYERAVQDWVIEQTGKIMPAHLEYQIIFDGLTWAQVDSRELTFAQLDEQNLSWDELDNLQQE